MDSHNLPNHKRPYRQLNALRFRTRVCFCAGLVGRLHALRYEHFSHTVGPHTALALRLFCMDRFRNCFEVSFKSSRCRLFGKRNGLENGLPVNAQTRARNVAVLKAIYGQ
jgi:hypothetical protein